MRVLRRIWCFIVCGPDEGGVYDKNLHTWRCKRCGCDWGGLR